MMHPNVFLKTFWDLELRPNVFVAMSFHSRYVQRYDQVIVPAICALKVDDVSLTPFKVDLSRSGECILTEIMDGIAHSQLVLADISTLGHDRDSGDPYRNGNVMYELGLALACRQPSEVLVIKDDHDKSLFDVSHIPFTTIDFTDQESSTNKLKELLDERIKLRKFEADARVIATINSLTTAELGFMTSNFSFQGATSFTVEDSKENLFLHNMTIPRLLDKKIIRASTLTGNNLRQIAYSWTKLGLIVTEAAVAQLTTPAPIAKD